MPLVKLDSTQFTQLGQYFIETEEEFEPILLT